MQNSNEQMRELEKEVEHWRDVARFSYGPINSAIKTMDGLLAAHTSAAEKLAVAIHDRDHAERQLAKVAAENMRLREAAEKYKPLVEAAKEVVRVKSTLPRCGNYIDILADALTNLEQE